MEQKGYGISDEYGVAHAYWKGETKSIKYIGGVHFPGDRKWETCLVMVRGTMENQSFVIEIQTDGKKASKEEFVLKQDEIRVIERKVQKCCSIDISGQIKAQNAIRAGASIFVTCSYSFSEKYQIQSVIFKTSAQGIISVDNLYLYATHLWEKCEIYIEGFEKGKAGYMLTLISNGEIDRNGKFEWLELRDGQSKTFSVELGRKVSVIVAGYIVSYSQAGTKTVITLTGMYK